MQQELSMTRRYLAVYLPLLPVERLIRTCGQAPDAPFALVEKQQGAMRLIACDRRALALGIKPGLALADARARVPELAVFDHDPIEDLKLLSFLVDGCECYTPSFMLDPPYGFLLDITGCSHLFDDDEQQLAKQLKQRLHRHGVTCRIALGATPDSARAKARYATFCIGDLPVDALDCGDKVHQALRRAGLRTIGNLASRPRQPLTVRFGKNCTVKLARLLEEEDVRITPRRSLPAIHITHSFAEPIARTTDILAIIKNLAEEAADHLFNRGKGGRRFQISLFRSDGYIARLAVDTGAPTRDPELLNRLIRERIDSLADPLDPGFGYDSIRLAIPVMESLKNVQMGLSDKIDFEAEAKALIDRLSVRLGSNRVRYFQMGNSHIPERNAFECSAQTAVPSGEWQKPQAGEPPLRPFRLFEPPQQVDTIAAIPDGPPKQFRWRKRLHQVVCYEGPERISPEWWRHERGYEPDSGSLTRDYYRVEDREGCRFWLFRRGLYDESEQPLWYLHGVFA